MITLNSEEFIYQSIASVYDFADQIWVADGCTPAGRSMAREDGGSIDKTLEILHSFPDPEHKLHIIPSRFYKDKNDQSNAYMEAMDQNPPDFVWQLDSDELYKPADLERIAQLITERNAGHVMFRALHFWHNLKTVAWNSWWSTPENAYHRVNKFQKGWRYVNHRPPTILLNNRPIWEIAPVITAEELDKEGIFLYHYSHVTERQVRQKMEWYANDRSWSGHWYEKVWKRWENEPEAVECEIGTHPVNLRSPGVGSKGITRAFKGEHPPAMETHPLWQKDFKDNPRNNKNRVLHIVNYLTGGGGCVSPMEFASRANQEIGQEHHFLILEKSSGPAVSLPPNTTIFENNHRTMADCAKWISTAGYDVIHWHWWLAWDSMRALMIEMAKYGGHKRIITCDVYPSGPEYRLSKSEIDYADMVVFDGKDAMAAYPQIPDSKKTYIIGGTDLSPYTCKRTRGSDGRFRMGRGSILNEYKCPLDIIEMVAPILHAIPNSEFHVFGQGFTQRLQADIKRLNLTDRVFLRGWVPNFAEEIANLDLYLYHLPKLSYASSELNLQGAMAARLPIVIMPSLGTRWMFEHGKDALVADTPEQALNYCIRLSKDTCERDFLGGNAHAKAFEQFGIENMVKGYLERVYPKCQMRFIFDSYAITAQNSYMKYFLSLRKALRAVRSTLGRVYRFFKRNCTRLCQSGAKVLEKSYYGLVFVKPNYYLKSPLSTNSIVVDIGIGEDADFSMFLVRKYGLQSYGFEPTIKHHPGLNKVVNNAKGNFKYFPFALSNKSGEKEFHESLLNISGSFFSDHTNMKQDGLRSYAVRVVTLEEIFQIIGRNHIDVLKMDVEGEEYAVIDSVSELTLGKINQLVIEFHHKDVSRFSIYDTEKAVQKIMKAGFQAYTRDSINYLFFRS